MSDCSDDEFDCSGSENEEMSEDDGMEMADSPPKDPASDCVVLTQEALQKEMSGLISEVSNIIQISHGASRILLQHFKWNKESVMEKFYESSNVSKFLQGARVAPDPLKLGDGVQRRKRECTICCDFVVLTGLSCRHYACKSCWEQYISTKVLVNNTSIIECLFPGCKLLVDDEFIHPLIDKNEPARTAFKRLSLDGFVGSNALLRWCPAIDCGRAVKVSHCESRVVQCSCKCRFCFECGVLEAHEPINCTLLRLWVKKCKDDSETSNWIVANTKDCPKCHTAIEKNGGCNHMTCHSNACKNEFCWICLGPWKQHTDNNNCNRFDEKDSKKARSAQEKSRAALERYLHYYNRYTNHQQSLGLEKKLVATVEVKMDLMQKVQGAGWADVQYLKKAVDVLSECRRTLMYTYAFAFYLNKTNEKEMFEDNQRDLELATEQLSGFLERDMEMEDLVRLKQNVQDKYRYVEQRRIELLKHCAEGVERGTWCFNQ